MILPSDKGRAVVVLDRDEYDLDVAARLYYLSCHWQRSNTLPWTSLRSPDPHGKPETTLERRMKSILLSLHRKGELPRRLYDRLRSPAGLIPHLYGLPKIHKSGRPLWPSVSFINSPTYNLSKHLASFLSPLVGHSTSSVRNSGDLSDFVSSVVLLTDTGVIWCGLTFTKILTELAIDVARRRLEEDENTIW